MEDPDGLRVRVSIRQQRLPGPGVEPRPWSWDDVLEGEPPSRRRGEPPAGRFVVRHGLDEAPDPESRLAYATVVEADARGVRVDERVAVEPRLLGPMLRVERSVSRHLEKGGRLGVRLVEGSTTAAARVLPGTTGRVVERGGGLLARGVGFVADSLRDGLRALVEAPDNLVAGAGSAEAHLRQGRERRAFLRGMLDPPSLSREGKAAALFVAGVGVVALALVVTLGVALVAPQLAVAWRSLMGYFFLGLGSTLLFPFFPELRLVEVAAVAGPVAAVLAVSLGMTAGGWMVLFLGDAVHGALRRSVPPASPFARALDRVEAFAQRNGFLVAFLLLAIPYGPDTPVFYVLATVRTPTAQYLLGTLLGTLVRFSLTWVLLTAF